MTLKPGSVITQGHRNRHGSIRHLWLPIKLHRNYWSISYRFRDKRQFQSKIAKFAKHMHATTWPVHSECKTSTYSESQTPSFLLTVQLSSGYDDG